MIKFDRVFASYRREWEKTDDPRRLDYLEDTIERFKADELTMDETMKALGAETPE